MFRRQVSHAALLIGLLAASGAAAAAQPARGPGHDAFYWVGEMNKASTVMVVETGIVPPALGKTIAQSVAKVIADADQDPKLRSGDYLTVEPMLIAAGGPDVTRLHSGRSRQDMGATSRRLTQREQILETMASLDRTRARLLDFAAKHPNAIVPAYTWGVQAQPISFGHWILAYSEALERDSGRLKSAYLAANQSPFGSAALGTSSFPVDRRRLAELLGFDGVIVNSLDANQVSPIDTGAEMAGTAASIALTLSTFISDLEAQYRMATPWLILTEGELTGVSSIMPQKRNPTSFTAIRTAGSDVIGLATTFYFKAHNVPAGMGDYKGGDSEAALRRLAGMLDQTGEVVTQLNFDEKRALDEVNADYSATTELADTLQREGNVPFRVGHHFASELVTFGRQAHLRASEIKYADAQRIYTASAKTFGMNNAVLPLNEATFRKVLTAENMVAVSKGLGGPQPAEVARMLAAQRAQLQADRAWAEGKRANLDKARQAMNQAFEKIRTAP